MRGSTTYSFGWMLCAMMLGCAASDRTPYSYFDERIAPVLDVGCQRQTTGCHVDDGHGFALGNLDLSSYDGLAHRYDVLAPYGPYPVGLLLLKAGDPVQVQVRTVDPPDAGKPERRYVTVTTDIRHGGGQGAIAQGSADYALLKQWIDGGFAQNGVPRSVLSKNQGGCSPGAGAWPGIDVSRDPDDSASYEDFVKRVQPVLKTRCAGSSCHGNKLSDLYLSCGDNAAERRSNYAISTRYLSELAVSSELLRRPLALRAGGVFHEGGDVLEDTEDPDYKVMLAWAIDLAKRRPKMLRFTPEDPGLRFFANRVQPVLVRKGCMFLACHSPAMFHDLRLRGGSRGDFSEIATRRNHQMARMMLALQSPDPNDSRLLAKNLCTEGTGVRHRGGALLEDFGSCSDPETRASVQHCVGVDAEHGDLNEIPAYCVLARWQALERELAIARGELDDVSGLRAIVWVARPEGIGGPTDFDAFRPGADLLWADATTTPDGSLSLGDPRSLLAACDLPDSVDVRGPAVSWDGKRIAFAARKDASTPLRLYEVDNEGADCAPIRGVAAARDEQDGILLHDFDPAYAPDGRLVFASTRGMIDGDADRRGPTRTPAALQPNANLFVFEKSAKTPVRELTYLLDQELAPSFMADGRVIFSTEKRGQDFHQLAGRRQNLDGGDYHPLFAQRPSIGFESATEIVELSNGNLAMVAAPLSAHDGGGAIVIVNRSIGPDQQKRDARDKAYIHSLTDPEPGALGGDHGIFRSPAPLPTGRLVASCDLAASRLDVGSPHYGLCELDPSGHAPPRLIYSEAERVAVEAVAVFARTPVEVYASRQDEVNGSTTVAAGSRDAVVHYTDVPMLGTLLFSNTRGARVIDDRIAGVKFYEPLPPPNGATSFPSLGDDVIEDRFGRFYESLRVVGSAALEADGSVRVRLPGGVPLSLALTGGDGDVLRLPAGAPLAGPMRQREAMQFYPGEQAKQALPRRLFNGVCAGCHGSISGRELDVGISIDVLTSASRTLAGDALVDLR